MIMSPYKLSMEGITVTRCVQNPGQYVIIFPGSYYSAFDCGFNCLEKANFAPLGWLPHGDIAVQLNQEKRKKSRVSYDKLLVSASREAVDCLKEYALTTKITASYMTWKDYCGKDGMFTNIVKSRIKQEKSRREFLSNSLNSQRIDKRNGEVSKMECSVCLADLYISAVKCSCSAERYSCLTHMRKLCACPCDKKTFLNRFTMDELNILVEALEGVKLSSMFKWGSIDKKHSDSLAISTGSQRENKGKDVAVGASEQTRVKARTMADILNVKVGDSDSNGPLESCSTKSKRPCEEASSSAVSTTKKQKQG